MPVRPPKPYAHVRLIEDKERIPCFEIRISTYVEFVDSVSWRAITGLPTKEEALRIAKEIG